MQIQKRLNTNHLTASISECRKTESMLATSRTRRSQLRQLSVTKLQNKTSWPSYDVITLLISWSLICSWSRSGSRPAPHELGTNHSNLTHESFTPNGAYRIELAHELARARASQAWSGLMEVLRRQRRREKQHQCMQTPVQWDRRLLQLSPPPQPLKEATLYVICGWYINSSYTSSASVVFLLWAKSLLQSELISALKKCIDHLILIWSQL